MMTGRVASKGTSNDFDDLAGLEMMSYEMMPQPQLQPESRTSHIGWPDGGSTT